MRSKFNQHGVIYIHGLFHYTVSSTEHYLLVTLNGINVLIRLGLLRHAADKFPKRTVLISLMRNWRKNYSFLNTLIILLLILVDSSDEDNAFPPLYHATPKISYQHLSDTVKPRYTKPCYKEDSVIMKNSCKPGIITLKYKETNPAINEIY